MVKYGSRGYAMKMASMRARYRNHPKLRRLVKRITRMRRRR